MSKEQETAENQGLNGSPDEYVPPKIARQVSLLEEEWTPERRKQHPNWQEVGREPEGYGSIRRWWIILEGPGLPETTRLPPRYSKWADLQRDADVAPHDQRG